MDANDSGPRSEPPAPPALPVVSGEVPVFDCHVIVSPSDAKGQVSVRVASLPRLTATASTERDALRQIVSKFKAEIQQYRSSGEPIPWQTPPDSPGDDERERWIAVHL